MRWLPTGAAQWQKRTGFWDVKSRVTACLLLFVTGLLFLSGCKAEKEIRLNQQELQALVSEHYLSPQIRTFELFPLVNTQVYLDTPELVIRGDNEPLEFTLTGSIDADLFGNTITGQIPLKVRGTAHLHYQFEDETFYFSELILKDALIDLEVSMIQALVMDQFRSALSKELSTLPIIPLKPESLLARKLGQKNYQTTVEKSQWVIPL